MSRSLILIATAVFLGAALSSESAVYSKEGKMIFTAEGGLAMSDSAAMGALKELGVGPRDAAQLTKFITNDSQRAVEIQRLDLVRLSGSPSAKGKSTVHAPAEARAASPTRSARAHSRSKSPVAAGSYSPAKEEVDWAYLEDFMRMNKDRPMEALRDLQAVDPRGVGRLCDAILDADFYEKAKAVGVGTIKNRQMVSFCQDYMPERAQLKEVRQGERAKSPVREKVTLRPVVLPSAKASLEEQQRGLEEARQALLENAEMLGKRAEMEDRLAAIQKMLKRAQERYDNLTAVILGMKEDLPAIQGFKPFCQSHQNDLPDVYINHLTYFLENEGKHLVIARETKAQIPIASNLLAQAKDNLENARYDLEQINRELLKLTK